MPRHLAAAAALLSLAATLAVLLQLPWINGPEEWQWVYREPGLDRLWGGVFLVLCALALLALYRAPRRLGMPGTLALLVPLGFFLTLALLAAQPGGLGRVVRSLVSRHSFSYVFDAGLASPAEVLGNDPEVRARLSLHSRTHPPGPLLAVRALDAMVRPLAEPRGPERAGGLLGVAEEALAEEVQRVRARKRPVPTWQPEPLTVVLLALLLPALSALAAWPVARLALAWGLPADAALLAALAWLLVPARSLFTPSLDQALAFFLLLAAGWAGRGPVGSAAAGLVLGTGCFLSYGLAAGLPLVLVSAVAGPCADAKARGRVDLRSWGPRAAALIAGAAGPWLLLALATGYRPLGGFIEALAEHRAMAVASRDYLTWLVHNPRDLALLLGPAVFLLALAALGSGGPGRSRWLAWTCWGILAALLLSGSVRGEVGRIWLPLMPFASILAAARLGAGEGRGTVGPGLLIALQAVLTLALAATMVFVR